MNKIFSSDFLKSNLMGPNAVTLIDELVKDINIQPSMRILDLGCGKGLTSIYLADKFRANIFATDLWIPASENHQRFRKFGLDKYITPIHAEAHKLPYADEFFDIAVSIDSYHYYGRDETYMDTCLAPLIKKGGLIALAIPGLKYELHDNIPSEMLLSWGKDDLDTIQSYDWWKKTLAKSKLIEVISITEMNCFEESWNDWLACDNPYAVNDRKAMEAGAGKYMNLIAAICRRK